MVQIRTLRRGWVPLEKPYTGFHGNVCIIATAGQHSLAVFLFCIVGSLRGLKGVVVKDLIGFVISNPAPI